MPLFIVLGVAFALLFFLWYAVAREPGPGPADVAIAYEKAWAELDYALLYALSGDELHDGMRRDRFIAAKRRAHQGDGRPAPIGAQVHVETVVSGNQTALVVTRVEVSGASVRNNVMLEKRSNGWVVVGYTLRPGAEADSPTA